MSWQRVRGHEALVQAFERVVQRGRLGHAYLFTGPPGIGKRLFAGELAKALLCAAPPAGRLEACDQCPACSLVEAGTHPDFFSAGRPEDKLELPIEVMRDLCAGLSMKPARSRRKVAVLDDADDLNDEAANCFLKTLEEPHPHSLLLLIGTSPDRQLPTIVSRCQIVRFFPLPEAVVADLIRSQGVEDPALVKQLARLSGGSPGQAMQLADSALWEFRRDFLQGLTKPRPDSVALAKTWTRFVEEAGKESASQRLRASLALRLLIDFFSDALCVSVGGTPQWLESEDAPFLQEMVKCVNADRLQTLLDRCLEADYQIDRRVQLVLVIEALLDAIGQKAFPTAGAGSLTTTRHQ